MRRRSSAAKRALSDREVQAGFQRIEIDVDLKAAEGVPPAQLEALAATAEQCCVVLQTLRGGVQVSFSDSR